jgi:hypothetical protein
VAGSSTYSQRGAALVGATAAAAAAAAVAIDVTASGARPALAPVVPQGSRLLMVRLSQVRLLLLLLLLVTMLSPLVLR